MPAIGALVDRKIRLENRVVALKDRVYHEKLGSVYDKVERMEAWRRNTPRDKHGDHRYDPAEFGLDPGTLRQQFAFYTDRFNLPTATR